MRKVLFIFSLIFISQQSYSDDYLVLFKQSEINVGSLDHEAYTHVLQETNKKSVADLEAWLGNRGVVSRKEIKNLWLVRGATVSVKPEVVGQLKKEPWVRGVYLDQIRQMISPQTSAPSGNTVKEVGVELWGLEKIGLSKIRQEFPQIDGTGVRIGVLDTGVQSRHPELAGRVTHFKDFINSIDNEYDDHGHGTHVSGTIAGTETGIASKSSLLVGKIFGAAGAGQDSTILEAMQWQFDPDGNPSTADYPMIVSNSWGSDIVEGVHDIDEFLPYHVAIQTWINGGIIPVFAAGNSGKSPNGIPGGLPEVIAVGAIDSNGEVGEFSSMGPNIWKIGQTVLTLMKPDISAPGVAIASSIPGNKYSAWDGTSMATPHVSGAVALLLQANPKLRYAEVKQLLLETSEKKIDNKYGFGILNAYELVKAGLKKTRKNP